jgi:hypothetical protein
MSLDTERHLRLVLVLPVGLVPVHGPEDGFMKRRTTEAFRKALSSCPTRHVATHSTHVSLLPGNIP